MQATYAGLDSFDNSGQPAIMLGAKFAHVYEEIFVCKSVREFSHQTTLPMVNIR